MAIVVTNDIQGTTDQHPKLSPDGKWVSFTRGTRKRRELYRVATAGGELQKLTNDGQYVTGHAWLREDIVFSSDRFGSRQLWYLSNENQAISSLGFPGVRLISTSHDGTKVAFESAHYTANIYRLAPDETESAPQKIISSSAYDNYPSLSPNGDFLAFVSNRSGLVSIWMADANSWETRMLLQQPRNRITDPAWSEDGKKLLATRYTEGTSQILEFSPETRQVKVLSEIGENVYGARFSGSWIYFIHHGLQDPVLARFPANGEGSVELTTVIANRAMPAEDGQIYFTRPARDGIFMFDPVSGSEKVLTPDLPAERWQSWTVNKSWLVYVREVTNGGQVVIRKDLENDTTEVVSSFAPDTVGGTIEISSDGKTLFVARTDRADLDIKMIDLAK
jgi:Tol biopolymer transport system component